ncbi:SMI1/KNR4 family protein [Streptomyces olivaceoviridis]|uniref:SMI1/KNR4 family protein n=1 Tax=Streptomyces olivaceoviridis TaxID=1921 RepID=UPI003700DCF5
MWIELITSLSGEVGLADPVDEDELVSAELALGLEIPEDLKSFLRESNGATDEFGCGFVWSAADIVSRNREMKETADFRSLYMPFDSLLFIGDSGGGDLFAFVVEPPRYDIFVWQHESDNRRWVARNLRDYVRRYLAAGGEDWYES